MFIQHTKADLLINYYVKVIQHAVHFFSQMCELTSKGRFVFLNKKEEKFCIYISKYFFLTLKKLRRKSPTQFRFRQLIDKLFG